MNLVWLMRGRLPGIEQIDRTEGGNHPSMSKTSLSQLATLRFPNLSGTETSVFDAAENGQEAAATSPSILRAEALEWLCTDNDAIKKVHRHGLAIRGYAITGLLDLIHADIRFPVQMRDCAFDNDIWLKGARLRSLTFRTCTLQGMNADSAVIDTNILLIEGCETHG